MKQQVILEGSRLEHGACTMATPRKGIFRNFRVVIALIASILVLAACGTTTGPAVNPDNGGKQLDIAAMENTDIGPVLVQGAFEALSEQTAIIHGSGRDIWDQSDEFHFAYLEVQGDFEVKVQVHAVAYTDEWAKAGLMVRQALTPDSAHALIAVTPAERAGLTWRPSTGASSDSVILERNGAPLWLRLTRVGNSFTGYLGDGTSEWQVVHTVSIGMGASAYVGLALTSHAPSAVANATFSSFSISPEVVGAPEPAPPTNPNPPTPSEPPVENPAPPEPPVENPAPPTSPEPPIEDPAPPIGDVLTQWVCASAPLAPAYTPTLFVSTTGSDSNSGRRESEPLRTLAAVARIVQPGDVVWVRGGTYSSDVAFYRSGTASSPIVIESYPGECAILDGSGLTSRSSKLRFEGVSHYVFRNFVVRNSPGDGVTLFQSHNNVLSNIESYGNYWAGIAIQRSDNNLLSHVIAHHNYDAGGGGGDADGIGISAGDGNRIQYCISYSNSDDGVDTWLSTNTVVDRCISFNNGFQAQGDGNGFKLGGQGQRTGTLITNSISFGNRRNGFDHNTSPGVTVRNSTAFDNGGWGFVVNNGTMVNNLALGNSAGDAYRGSGNSLTTNSWDLGISSSVLQSTDTTSDNFLSLLSSSQAIGAGTGATPDLGALQLGETIQSVFGIQLSSLR